MKYGASGGVSEARSAEPASSSPPQPATTAAAPTASAVPIFDLPPRKRGMVATAAAYSTVTVFARLRGWSTLRPLRRAM